MRKSLISILFLLFVAGQASPAAALWGKDLRVGVRAEYNQFMGGAAGNFNTDGVQVEPGLVSIYGSGFGARAELGYIYDINYEFIVGAGYLGFTGGSDTETTPAGNSITLELGDVQAIPMYIGARFLFGDEPDKGFVPFIRADIGFMYMQDVNARITYLSPDPLKTSFSMDTKWFKSGGMLIWDMGAGLEYRFGKFGVCGEVFYQHLGKPDSASSGALYSITYKSETQTWTPFTARAGLSYYF